MDFPDVNSLQTKLDDAEKQLATAQLEMEQLKEKQKLETARLRKRWKEETDNLKAELQQANMDVEYLNRRLEEEKTRDTADLVSETVRATLEQFINPFPVPFPDKLQQVQRTLATSTKAHERNANAAAAIPSASGDFKAKAFILGQRVSAVSSNIPPSRPPSPNAMDWSPSGSPVEPGRS